MKKIYLILSLILLGCSSSEPKSVEEFKTQANAIMPMLSRCDQEAGKFFSQLWNGEFQKLSASEIKKKQENLKALQAKCKLAKQALFALDLAQYNKLSKNPKKAKELDTLCEKELEDARKKGIKDYLAQLKSKHIKHYLECKNASKVMKELFKTQDSL